MSPIGANEDSEGVIELDTISNEEDKAEQSTIVISSIESGESEVSPLINYSDAMKKIFESTYLYIISRCLFRLEKTIVQIIAARSNPEDLPASGLIFPSQDLLMLANLGQLTATSVCVGQLIGAKKLNETGNVLHNSLILATVFSIPTILLMENIGLILKKLGQDEKLAEITQDYFNIYVFSVPLQFYLFSLQQFALGIGKSNLVLMSQIFLSCLKILSSYLLANGIGFPKLEVNGLAYADIFSTSIILIGLTSYFYVRNEFLPYDLFKVNLKHNLANLKELLKIGFPIFIQCIVELGVVEINALLAGMLGDDALSVQRIISVYLSIVIGMLVAFESPFSVLISNYVPNNQINNIKRFTIAGSICTVGATLLPFTIFSIMQKQLLAPFFDDINDPRNSAIIKVAKMPFIIMGLLCLIEAARFVSSGTLLGFKNTSIALLGGIAFLLVDVPLAYVLSSLVGIELDGIFTAQLLGALACAIITIGGCVYKFKDNIENNNNRQISSSDLTHDIQSTESYNEKQTTGKKSSLLWSPFSFFSTKQKEISRDDKEELITYRGIWTLNKK